MIPAMLNNGGIKVAAQWTRLLLDNGHGAILASTNGDKCKGFWNFEVPTCSFSEVQDVAGNIIVWNWGPDLPKRHFHYATEYYYAQDCCQPHYPENQIYMPLLKQKKLLTIGHHSKWFYEYTQGLKVHGVINNYVDTEVFRYDVEKTVEGAPVVCMMKHREHWNPNIIPRLKAEGFEVEVAEGTQAQVAASMRKSRYFISFAPGVKTPHGHIEGFPLPTAEAMAAGCITLCLDNAGNTEYILDKVNAYYHSGEDSVISILKALEPAKELRRVVALNSHITFTQKFNKQNTYNQIKAALQL